VSESIKVHIFSNYFFTKLFEGGPPAVKKWTTKTAIDIFECKFVFIPICEANHWSFCVLVNPGQVLNATKVSGNKDDPLGCLIFLDPALCHDKYKIRSNIIRYLNYEWNHSKKSEELPFTSQTYPMFTPKGNMRSCSTVAFDLFVGIFFSLICLVNQFLFRAMAMIAEFLFASMLHLYSEWVTRRHSHMDLQESSVTRKVHPSTPRDHHSSLLSLIAPNSHLEPTRSSLSE